MRLSGANCRSDASCVEGSDRAVRGMPGSPRDPSDGGAAPKIVATAPPSIDSFWFVPSSLRRQIERFADAQRMERLEQCRRLEESLRRCQTRQRALVERSTVHGRQQQQQGSPTDSTLADDKTREQTILRDEIESTVPGLRMMKYFGWRGIVDPIPYGVPSDGDTDSEGDDRHVTESQRQKSVQQIDQERMDRMRWLTSTCAREQHALWGCRATAVACGDELVKLKRCFSSVGTDEVLSCPVNNYARTKSDAMGDSDTRSSSSSSSTGTQQSLSSNRPDLVDSKIPCAELQRVLGSCVTKNANDLYQRSIGRSQS